MSLIVGEAICKSWSEKDVLRNVSLSLAPQERVGLVGPNGQGKTTLLRILAGLEPPTSGTIQTKTGLRIGYLPQDPPALEANTLRKAMLDVFADLHRIELEMHELAHQMGQDPENPSAPAGADDKVLRRYGALQHRFEDRGGYSYSHKIDQVLGGLNLPAELWDKPLAHLSGGQRTRAFLARLLLEEPDVLMLDEPTNHLDLEAIEWLEQWMDGFAGAVIVVSHDRYFLDRATTRTWEVAWASLESYRGSYTHYLQQREERFKERLRRWEAQQEYVAQTEDFIRRFIAGQRSKEAQGRRTRLLRFLKTEAIQRPREHPRISVRLKALQRTGDFVLHLADLAVGYEPGKPLLRVPKLDIQRGWRVAIVGPNGCGKTTLLKTILGELPPLEGTARRGGNVRVGYLSQMQSELSPEATALESLRKVEPTLTEQRGRDLLGGLLLSGDDAFKKISELSGGQRSRVVLAMLVLQKANVLVLDEPTNHLDIASQEVFQDVLTDFDGTVIFVSHDRYLIQALSTHLWAVDGGEITELAGNWDMYLQWRQRRLAEQGLAVPDREAGQAARDKQQRKDDFKQRRKHTNEVQRLQRRLAEVEAAIATLETHLKALNDEISRASEAGDVDRITKLGQEYAADDAKLREFFAEWEQTSSALEEAGAE